MERLYIIVQTNKTDYDQTLMITRNSDREVIAYAGVLSLRGGLEDDIVINRIFSVNEYGIVGHHQVTFSNGKLVLETLPEQSK